MYFTLEKTKQEMRTLLFNCHAMVLKYFAIALNLQCLTFNQLFLRLMLNKKKNNWCAFKQMKALQTNGLYLEGNK